MRVGVFADAHDHLDHLRRAVALFNQWQCELVIFAGDLVSSFAVPPLRSLRCPVIGCFGDNEGNKRGVEGGWRILGEIGEPPLGVRLADGTRVLVTHMLRQLEGATGDFDLCVYAHTHRAELRCDAWGRLLVNPGELSGWSFGRPSVALVETAPRQAWLIDVTSGSLLQTDGTAAFPSDARFPGDAPSSLG
jgi:uncharacterized protein